MKINGGELIARCLVANGITHAFNVPGLGLHPLLDALKRHQHEIDYRCGPSETAVTLMADGYGRVTRRPAFVNVYHASGTALGLMGITTAWADRSPMLFTTTTSARSLERRDQYAAVPENITDVTRQFTKWHWEVPSVQRIPEAIARAVLMASTPPMGPVHLAFPMDLLTELIDEDEIPSLLLADPGRFHVYSQMCADARGIEHAARLLREAQRPLIVAGGDVAHHHAVDELIAIAEGLGAPVMSEPYVAYMGFPNGHANFAGRFSPNSPLVKEADVILAVGVEFTSSGPAQVLPPPSARVIFMSPDARDMGKQVWADVGLIGHPKASLQALQMALASGTEHPQPALPAHVSQAAADYHQSYGAERERGWNETPIRLGRLVSEVEKVFGDEALIVDHATTGTPYLLQMYGFKDPGKYYGITGRASAQGWGTPAAIGMQIAAPDRRVVAFVGDGGFMFTSTSLYAAAQWNTPLVLIVLSNGGWHDVAYGARKNRQWSDEDIARFRWECDPPIDYSGLARSLGIRAIKVEHPSQLEAALLEAKSSNRPTLLEVISDPGATEYYLSFISR